MSDKTYKELTAELEECQQQMFDRYDLDGSVSKAAPSVYLWPDLFRFPRRKRSTRARS